MLKYAKSFLTKRICDQKNAYIMLKVSGILSLSMLNKHYVYKKVYIKCQTRKISVDTVKIIYT